MAIKIQKGGWVLIFLIGLALVGFGLYKYGLVDLSRWMPNSSSNGNSGSVMLRVHGSNTIGAQLAPALAEAFLRQRGATSIKTTSTGPDTVVVQGTLPDQSVPRSIEIAAHGSATAFTDLRANNCDVGAASRKIESNEMVALASLGDMGSPASEHVLGLDGIAVIVNASNPIRGLAKDEIRRIFAGEITDWSELNRPEAGSIRVLARDDKSGTWDTFKNLVLGSTPLVSSAQRLEDSRQLADRVAADSNAIGFVGLPFVRSAKAIAVSDAGTPIFPTALTIATEDYPLSRRLYLYTAANPQNPDARDFVSFALSRAGQEVVTASGFVGQTVVPAQPDSASARQMAVSDAGGRYGRTTSSAARLPLDFRFRTGSANLDNKALDDLGRVATFASSSQYAGQVILLLGFADSSGSPQKNDELSKDRAMVVAQELRARGIKVADVIGFGSERPVASNATAEGREKNRRVEVWLRR
jgi:phosphate transport system substrate-binding protein